MKKILLGIAFILIAIFLLIYAAMGASALYVYAGFIFAAVGFIFSIFGYISGDKN